jgi:hypothetical protein
MTRFLPVLALLAAPAAAFASGDVLTIPVATLAGHPAQYVGQHVETEGYLIDRSGGRAMLGATNGGVVEADTLMVTGPQTQALNYFDRFRVTGVVEAAPDTQANGSNYLLQLSAPPQTLGQ